MPRRRWAGPRFVAGTDGSASALAALRQAAGLASTSGAVLHVVSAHRGDEEGAWAVLRRSADELAGMPLQVAWHAEDADPASALVGVAERVGAEMIVVGNRGVDAILPLFVAERLAGFVAGTHEPALSGELRRAGPVPVAAE